METTAILPNTSTSAVTQSDGLNQMGSEDFLKLLVAQLASQDPLEPMTNQELLDQISTIRQIEQSTALTDSLQRVIEEQRFGSAAGLIGQYVTGHAGTGDDAQTVRGTVTAVRFDPDGQVVLVLDNGQELSLSGLEAVTTAEQAARQLVGMQVTGVDTRDPAHLTPVEGIVTNVRADQGDILLELDTGQQLRFADVVAAGRPTDSTGQGTSAA